VHPSPALALFSLVVVTLIIGCVWCWAIALARAALSRGWLPAHLAAPLEEALLAAGIRPQPPLVIWTPRRPVPWALFDLMALVAIWFVANVAVSVALKNSGGLPSADGFDKLTLSQRELLTGANIVISLVIAAIGLPLAALRVGATLRDFGWSAKDVVSDLRLGLIGFIMLAPPTYALQALLVFVWKPSNHPLMEMFKSTPDARFFVLLIIAAAIVAPIFEELMFRVLLQGFLEKAVCFRGEIHELFFGALPRRIIEQTQASVAAAAEMGPQISVSTDPNPYQAPRTRDPPANGSPTDVVVARLADEDQQPLTGHAAWLPIAISSLVFALMHYSHGPDWVPLTFLAAGMGYLYQRTHRLLPSLVVHMSLNGLSMWGLWVYVAGK
jgi:membrane protease YdiL (CAAX protease family)